MLMVPMVVRTTEEMVQLVPNSLREAALALGYPRWRTSLPIVVRTALPGIVTGSLLAVARVAGETAPLLFTALGNQYLSFKPRPADGGAAAAGLHLRHRARTRSGTGSPGPRALVLILLVLVLSLAARMRHPPSASATAVADARAAARDRVASRRMYGKRRGGRRT